MQEMQNLFHMDS